MSLEKDNQHDHPSEVQATQYTRPQWSILNEDNKEIIKTQEHD